MFGVSFTELLLVLAIALIIFGPEKLPEMAKTLGKLLGELKKQSEGVRKDFYNALYTPAEDSKEDFRKNLRSVKSELLELKEEIAAKSKSPESKE